MKEELGALVATTIWLVIISIIWKYTGFETAVISGLACIYSNSLRK